MLRHPALPAASRARTVTELLPTRSGITADHMVVPVATPAVPKLVAQESSVTPTLSLAVPEIMIDEAVVDMVPVEGVVIVNAGAVVSGDPPPVPLRDCRVMVTDRETRLARVDAVMVMVFVPITNGTLTMLQAEAGPVGVPKAPLLDDHVTVMTPVPPPADPDKLTVDAVVVEIVAFTVRTSGPGGGGTIVTEVCGAYSVRIAATSGAAKVVAIL